MGTLFDDEAFEQLIYWMKENRKNADKIQRACKRNRKA